MKCKARLKILLWSLAGAVIIMIAVVIGCDLAVVHNAKGRMYDNVDSIQHRRVGLVLGTSPISIWTGRRNIYYDCRMQAAADLIHSGKVDYLIVSGGDYRDTEANGFDEPAAMRNSLMTLGVDSAQIVLDYDGTRTLNSIANIKKVYHTDSIIIISQKYHNERALFQADHLGVDAIALNAHTPSYWPARIRNRGREYMARVKLFIDILLGDIK